MDASIRGILRAHFSECAQTNGFPGYVHRTAHQLARCRTPAMGGHVMECPDGHESHVVYHSCRHRLCPRCAALPRERWLAQMRERLLDSPHWHIIFTLPHELHPLWRFNRAWFTRALFESVSSTLRRLCEDPKHLGAQSGFVLALHTWGRSLALHPHIHALVTDGGLNGAGAWVQPRRSCFLPARVVMALFRGRLCATMRAALERDTLTLPPDTSPERARNLVNRLGRIKWNVHLCQRYDHGAGVMTYLARYVRGGVLHESQLSPAKDAQVRFVYQAHHDGGKRRSELLFDVADFLPRYLQHTPLPRHPVVRHYGLYATRNSRIRERARTCRGQAPCRTEAHSQPLSAHALYLRLAGKPTPATHCTVCGHALRTGILIAPKARPP